MALLPREIHTSRLTLRPYTVSDAEDILRYATDKEWQRFLPVPTPYTAADAIEFLHKTLALDWQQHPCWAICDEGLVIGGINIRFFEEYRVGEIGYAIAPQHWGKGMATEVVEAVLDAAFSAHRELVRIRARADIENHASRRVMEKVGMQLEGVLPKERLLRDELRDDAAYGILRDAWNA